MLPPMLIDPVSLDGGSGFSRGGVPSGGTLGPGGGGTGGSGFRHGPSGVGRGGTTNNGPARGRFSRAGPGPEMVRGGEPVPVLS
jgi:hypothetical protein